MTRVTKSVTRLQLWCIDIKWSIASIVYLAVVSAKFVWFLSILNLYTKFEHYREVGHSDLKILTNMQMTILH